VKINIPRSGSKSNIDLYFVIYLATIVGFFTIETELKQYQKSQDEILLEVARKEIDQLVNITETTTKQKNDSLYLEVTFEGDFDKNEFSSDLTFSYEDTINAERDTYLLVTQLKKNVDDENKFYAIIPLSDFGHYAGKPLKTSMKINFIPLISNETKILWEESFGSKKVVNKIEKNIYNRVKSGGSFTATKILETPVIPKGGYVKDFFIYFDKSKYSVLRGIKWEIDVVIAGVDKENELILTIIDGKALVEDLIKDIPVSTIQGIGLNSGEITLRGTRTIEGKSSTKTIQLVVFNPHWESPPITNEFYIGESYQFDGRVKEIPTDRTTVEAKSDLIPKGKESYLSPIVDFGPYKKSGSIDFQVFVDGIPIKELTTKIYVKKPPPPDIKIERKKKLSNEIIIIVTIYGKKNEIDIIKDRGGLVSLSKSPISIEKQINYKVYKYSATLAEPFEDESTQQVELYVKDKNKVKSDYKEEIAYY